MFVLQKLLARPGLFRSGAVQLAPARPASANVERPRITINAVRLASLGITLDPIGEHNTRHSVTRGGRP